MPFLSGFRKRKAIKISTAGIPASSLTSFPKLFSIISDTDIGAELTSQRLAVTLADGTTQVPYGSLFFNSSGGSATLKIRAKFSLSSSLVNGDTIGYLYYDQTATDQSNRAGVLDSNRKVYMPLEDTPSGSANDILNWVGADHGTSVGSMAASSAQKVANGLTFDGSDDRITVDGAADEFATGNVTFCCIAKLATVASAQKMLRLGDGPSNNDVYIQFGDTGQSTGIPADKFGFAVMNSSSAWASASVSSTISADTFYHIAGVYNGTDLRVYLDGSLEATTENTTRGGTASTHLTLGYSTGGGNFLNGVLDEVWMDNTARSADWIAYDYTDTFNNANTFTLGAEELEADPSRTGDTSIWIGGC